VKLCAVCCEAFAAKYRLATFLYRTGLKWHLTICATLSTYGVVHFTFAHALLLSSCATVFTALRSTEVLGVVELLLAFCEDEVGTAVAASDLLISHKIRRKRIMYSFLLSVSRDDTSVRRMLFAVEYCGMSSMQTLFYENQPQKN
jgi:hypothetical protein